MSIVLATASLLVAASRCHAQSAACGAAPTASLLTLSAGVGQSDRVDATASPFQFRGRGLDVAAAFARASGRTCVTADADGGTKLLSSREGTSATEKLAEANAGIAAVRATSVRGLALGLDARGLIAVANHEYDDPRHEIATYRIGAISLGPAVRFTASVAGGDALVQLSTPLVALIDHPYVAVWTTDPEPSFRFASAARYRGAHATVSYTVHAWRGVESVVSYRMNGVRYDDVHPLRSLSQSLTLGTVVPLWP